MPVLSVLVSVDPSTLNKRPNESPIFLSAKAGMTAVVSDGDDWWMGDILHVDGGARDSKIPTLFQIADVDSGLVRWVNADLVSHIVPRV